MLDIEELETQIHGLSIDYTKEKVKSSPEYDRLAKCVDRLSYLHKKSVDYAEDCTRTMEDVFNTIQKVKNSVIHELLTRRYLLGQPWEKIAVEMNFDYRWTLRLHSKALEEVRKIKRDDLLSYAEETEIWHTDKGNITMPKGTFDKIYSETESE